MHICVCVCVRVHVCVYIYACTCLYSTLRIMNLIHNMNYIPGVQKTIQQYLLIQLTAGVLKHAV